MKKIIFIMLISLSLQGLAQIKSGVYCSNKMYEYSFINGQYDSGGLSGDEITYIHIEDYAFRIYTNPIDAGETYHSVYIGKTRDGYDMYGVSPGERMEYKDGKLIIFYNFNYETLYYDNTVEFHNLEFINRMPNLMYED